MEAKLAKRLELLERPVEIRRFDVLADDIANAAAREARSADTFVALRPEGSSTPPTCHCPAWSGDPVIPAMPGILGRPHSRATTGIYFNMNGIRSSGK